MAGHSKWANIKRKKESTDAKRANVFSKIGKEITVAVKIGGSGDPNVNSRLKDVISKAKANNMPNDNINRCIQKAIGDSDSANYEEITYEGFGPFGTSIIVEAMTDNKNRAAADIRHIFSKAGGTMGQTGCVGYMFHKKGYFLIEKTDDLDEDTLMLESLEHGAEDFISEDEYIEIICEPTEYSKLRDYIDTKNNLNVLASDIRQIANIKKEISEEEEIKFQDFIEKLEENDDVQEVWHNVDV